ncbi:ATP-binding protein [Sphaerisporangium dianthi]|uniref:ATP-binding protein n=1 Tax=Sphaerisporangium dianthi TaxID=1436120 RepID=A0ABV9CLN1_9ACTN
MRPIPHWSADAPGVPQGRPKIPAQRDPGAGGRSSEGLMAGGDGGPRSGRPTSAVASAGEAPGRERVREDDARRRDSEGDVRPAATGGAGEESPFALVSVVVAVLRPGSACRRARALVREVLQGEGLGREEVMDAETIVSELVANAERHGRAPYELRVYELGGVPTWCEVVDGDADLRWIPAVLERSHGQTAPDLFAEGGRGLMLTRELSQGHCRAYVTTAFAGGEPAKAVAFALPTRSGTRLTCPPLLRHARPRARLLP